MSFEIILESGTQEVPTADVPGLIAAALHPDQSGAPLTVSYFIKTAKPGAAGTEAHSRGQPIDEAESKLLAEIWADMPPLPSNATEDEIRPYTDAFREKGAHLDWELGIAWNNPGLNAGMLRIQAEGEHRKGIIADIRAGRLAVIGPVSRRPTNEMHPASIVRVEELRRYVTQWDVSSDIRN